MHQDDIHALTGRAQQFHVGDAALLGPVDEAQDRRQVGGATDAEVLEVEQGADRIHRLGEHDADDRTIAAIVVGSPLIDPRQTIPPIPRSHQPKHSTAGLDNRPCSLFVAIRPGQPDLAVGAVAERLVRRAAAALGADTAIEHRPRSYLMFSVSWRKRPVAMVDQGERTSR